MIKTLGFVLAALAIATNTAGAAYAPDEVTSLPGWKGALPSKHCTYARLLSRFSVVRRNGV
jgi:hypothetical protein